jgi:hypothetical protein
MSALWTGNFFFFSFPPFSFLLFSLLFSSLSIDDELARLQMIASCERLLRHPKSWYEKTILRLRIDMS